MKVTDDVYELPLAIADTRLELAKILGLNRTAVYVIMDQAKRLGINTSYKEVEIDWSKEDEDYTG